MSSHLSEEKIKLGGNQPNQKILIFLHIMKAGGTTLNGIINQQYPKKSIIRITGIKSRYEIQNLPSKRRKTIKLIRGHFAFGLHYFLDCPTTYFTMLREPVDRFISLYYYGQAKRKKKGINLTLEEFIASHGKKGGNTQTKMLCGLTKNLEERHQEKMLEVAKDNIDKYFSSIGILERFEESLVLFRTKFNWNFPLYLQQNKSSNSPKKRDQLNQETLLKLKEYNALDIELYQYVSQKFQEEIDSMGESFNQELRLQQHFNDLYQPLGVAYNYARKQYFKQVWKNHKR